MGLGDQGIEVSSSLLILCQNDNVVVRQVADPLIGDHSPAVQFGVGRNALFLHGVHELQVNFRKRFSPVPRPVRICTGDLKGFGQFFKCSPAHVRHQKADAGRYVDNRPLPAVRLPANAAHLTRVLDESGSHFRVVGYERSAICKCKKVRDRLPQRFSPGYMAVADAGLPRELERKRLAGIDDCGEALRDISRRSATRSVNPPPHHRPFP